MAPLVSDRFVGGFGLLSIQDVLLRDGSLHARQYTRTRKPHRAGSSPHTKINANATRAPRERPRQKERDRDA